MQRLSTRPDELAHHWGEEYGSRHHLGGPGPVPTVDGRGRRRRGRWLVVVARPAASSELVGRLCTFDAVTPGRFHVLVAPTADIVGATAFVLASGGCVPVDPLTLAAGGAPRSGRARLDTILADLHRAGLDASGDLAHHGAVHSVSAALRSADFDGIAVLARPRPLLRRIGLELPQRLARRHALPVHRLGEVHG